MSKPPAGTVTPITLRWATAEDYRKATYQVGSFFRVALKPPTTRGDKDAEGMKKTPE